MSFFAELNRRNVIKVAVFYGVASWLILQVAELLFDVLGLPESWLRLVLALLVLGLPLVVVFAWVFELTPEGVKREKDVDRSQSITRQTGKRMDVAIVVLLVLAIATVGVDRLLPETPSPATPAEEAPLDADKSGPPAQSIAVLPFADLSPAGDQEYFSDGIAEEILNVLVRIEGLKVASRTTSWGFKGQEALGIPFMAEKMKVRHVLEGSVRKSGDMVRITAQLIDADTDQHLWSETYDRTLTASSIFEVQDDIATSIVEQLGIIMDADSVTPSHATDTRNIDAYELYLEAWQLFTERRSLRRAIDLFEQAVETDPGFARAWAGLSAVYNVAPGWGINDRDYRTLAGEAAETAVRLNPELSLPYAVLSFAGIDEWPVDFEQTLALLDEALARDPKNTTAYLWRAIRNLELGYFDRSDRDARQCLEIDPAYEICRSFLALAVLFAGDIDRALEIHETALRHGFAGNNLPFLYLFAATGEERTVLVALASNNAAQGTNRATAYEYRALVDPAFDYGAEKTLIDQAYFPAGATEPDWGPWQNDFLFHYRQYDQLNGNDLPFWWYPHPLEFRNSPHRKRLIRESGVAEHWRKHGFPPQCRPIGNNDFACD
jgi:TolB-like protein